MGAAMHKTSKAPVIGLFYAFLKSKPDIGGKENGKFKYIKRP